MSDERVIHPVRRTLGEARVKAPAVKEDLSFEEISKEAAAQEDMSEMQALLQQNAELSGLGIQERVRELPPKEQPKREVITNTSKDGPIPPPKTKPEQYAALKRNKDEDKFDDDDGGNIVVGKPRFVVELPDRDPSYQRITLLSGFIFYPFKDCQIRKINLPIHKKIMQAQKKRDLSLLIDAIGLTLSDGVDIRDLAMPDFYFILYWHRWNSYTTTPFNVTWTSKYGNRNIYRIVESSIKFKAPTITEERYAEWQQQGYCIPTVRDMEIFEREELTEDESWIFERAQFFVGIPDEKGIVSIESKIKAFGEKCADSIDALAKLADFKAECEFGMNEYIEITDAKFDPTAWMKILFQQASLLKEQAEERQEVNPSEFVRLSLEAENAKVEAESIATRLERQEEVLPDVERVMLNIGALEFFPDL